jgi:ABC-type uncharacterized transport system ATPase subunit
LNEIPKWWSVSGGVDEQGPAPVLELNSDERILGSVEAVDLAEQGLAIIMISSELPEILGMSDRICVMHEGTIAGTLAREEATVTMPS